MWYGHMGNWGYGMMGLGFGLGWIFQILFWALIIWLIVSLVRSRGGSCCGMGWGGHGGSQKEDNALEILKKRYAKGELSKEEFERMKKELE